MSSSVVAHRYAKALFQVAVESLKLDKVQYELDSAHQVFTENPDLVHFFRSPSVSRKEKLKMINELFKGKVLDLVLNFWQLLLEKNRIELLSDIFPAFEIIRRENAQIYKASLIFADKSGAISGEKMLNFIKFKADLPQKATVETEIKIDSSLIGGFMLFVDNKYFDYSLKGQLENLKTIIK